MNSVVYRPVRPTELEAAVALIRESFDRRPGPAASAEGRATFHRFACVEAIREREQAGGRMLVAELDGELAGVLEWREPGHLCLLFVHPSHQRCGIGRGLLAAITSLVGRAEMTVNSAPNARAAYERLGFEATGPEQCQSGMHFIPMRRSGV